MLNKAELLFAAQRAYKYCSELIETSPRWRDAWDLCDELEAGMAGLKAEAAAFDAPRYSEEKAAQEIHDLSMRIYQCSVLLEGILNALEACELKAAALDVPLPPLYASMLDELEELLSLLSVVGSIPLAELKHRGFSS